MVRLIERSTRRLRLTAEGALYRERAEALLGDLDALDAEVTGEARSPTGLIRINVSVPFGRHCLLPLLPEFRRTYPDIALDLTLTDEVVDLYAAQADIAFRAGALSDSSLLAIKLGDVRRRIVASPGYIEAHGTPQSASDLERHECLGFNFRRAAAVWPLRSGGRLTDREVHGLIAANNGETVRHLALLGSVLRGWLTTMSATILRQEIWSRCWMRRSSTARPSTSSIRGGSGRRAVCAPFWIS